MLNFETRKQVTSMQTDLTSRRNYLTSQEKDLTVLYNYLTSVGRG
jgi:hypothetical protein